MGSQGPRRHRASLLWRLYAHRTAPAYTCDTLLSPACSPDRCFAPLFVDRASPQSPLFQRPRTGRSGVPPVPGLSAAACRSSRRSRRTWPPAARAWSRPPSRRASRQRPPSRSACSASTTRPACPSAAAPKPPATTSPGARDRADLAPNSNARALKCASRAHASRPPRSLATQPCTPTPKQPPTNPPTRPPCSAADCVIPARGKHCVPTGLRIAVPPGTYGRVAPRSGLAVKHFIDVGAGVVDEDYRGELMVLLFNHSDADFKGEV